VNFISLFHLSKPLLACVFLSNPVTFFTGTSETFFDLERKCR
jgi:hypothetical protein